MDDDEINRFLDLSLPGLDELMAFLEIAAWVEQRVYDCILVDTAPSGHTLRLLTMPEFLRKWLAMLETLLAKHRYMKWVYARSREQDELDAFLEELAGSVKRVEEVLADSQRCSFVLVMLAEPMSLSETVSIVKEADYLKLPVCDIIVNKLYPVNDCRVCRHEYFLQARVSPGAVPVRLACPGSRCGAFPCTPKKFEEQPHWSHFGMGPGPSASLRRRWRRRWRRRQSR